VISPNEQSAKLLAFRNDLIRARAITDDVAEIVDLVVLALRSSEASVHAFKAGVDIGDDERAHKTKKQDTGVPVNYDT
jgi:hypothetical protein